MSEQIRSVTIDPKAFLERWSEYESRAKVLAEANKLRLCAVLAKEGVTAVTVSFDGCGDSGQIEDIAARAGQRPVPLPSVQVEYAELHFGGGEAQLRRIAVADAVERLAYACLELTHSGWENSDGAHGAFTFDISARSISLDYNERYVASERHAHTF